MFAPPNSVSVGTGLLLLLFGVVYHELEESREGGAVPPMAGSNCSPAKLS